MELVYLWVEDYKNLKEQGFNFSPRFICNYDKDTKKLTIDENKKYVSIFPENINVTAIVGENGSGKSSIAEIIANYTYQEFMEQKVILVYFNGSNFLFKQGYTNRKLNFNVDNKTKYTHEEVNKARTIDTIYFSNEIASIFFNPQNRDMQTYSNIDAYYSTDTNGMQNNKYDAKKEKIDKLEIFNKRFKKILEEDITTFKEIKNNMIFDSFRRELHFYEMGISFVENQSILGLLGKERLTGKVIFDGDSTESKENYLLKLLILFRIIQINNQKDIIEKIKDKFLEKDLNIEKCLKIFEYFDDKQTIYTKENIKDILEQFDYQNDEIWIENELQDIHDPVSFTNDLLIMLYEKIGRTDFVNKISKEYNYYSLSSGEREYISIFVAFIYHIKNLDKEFIFYFDEPDLGLHPLWQKKLVSSLIYYSKKYLKKKIHIILTSHSPFILSDLPKENVIFLKKGKQENIDIDTFGANIHTLLSHGFFMKDGLMGEFAKSKINEVIDFYNKVEEEKSDKEDLKIEYEKNKELFWHIHSIIGEDYLKQVVKNHLVEIEKKLYGKDTAKVKEIGRLKEQIKVLENDA